MLRVSRRAVVRGTLACAATSHVAQAAGQPADWQSVAQQYDVTREIVQLENGNFGTLARPVMDAYRRHLHNVNRNGSYYARRDFAADIDRIRSRVAAVLGVAAGEIAFTRGATEALQILIGGYNRLKPGDGVLISDLDYDTTQADFRWLVQRRGVRLVSIDLPEPATHQSLIDAYEAALADHPEIRLMLLTHLSHRTGLIVPVAEIVAMARKRNVDVVVDAAHSWGQIDIRLSELNADFVGLNCHKWIGAPLGLGILYIRASRLDAIDPFMGEEDGSIDHRVHTGTANFAGYLSIAEALDFREAVGGLAIEARLRALRNRWTEPLRDHPRLEILTPTDPRLFCGITSFRVRGMIETAQNRAFVQELLQRFRIFTVERSGVARGSCIRVTPALFTVEEDVDALVTALKTMT